MKIDLEEKIKKTVKKSFKIVLISFVRFSDEEKVWVDLE